MAKTDNTIKKKTNRKPFWQEHLKTWSQSGLTQAAYCREHQISAAAFGWWKRQLQGKPKSPKRSSGTQQSQHRQTPLQFVEMQCGPDLNTSNNPAIYEVLLSQGRIIRIDHRFDPKVLQRLIATVESSC